MTRSSLLSGIHSSAILSVSALVRSPLREAANNRIGELAGPRSVSRTSEDQREKVDRGELVLGQSCGSGPGQTQNTVAGTAFGSRSFGQ
jgi:hypothetical protein